MFFKDGNESWTQFLDRCEGRIQSEPEAKRARALLRNLRLDLRAPAQYFHNLFQEHVERLDCLRISASESMRACCFIDHVETPDCDHAVEMLKSAPDESLETCCMKVSRKVAEMTKPKPND